MKIIKKRHDHLPTMSECNELMEFTSYNVYSCDPATGVVYLTDKNRYFLSGHVRMRGEPNGSYPHFYNEMLDNLFGPEDNTIECCSYKIKSKGNMITVDINPEYKPDIVADAQDLRQKVGPNGFRRWKCDPPYNARTAKAMYDTDLPNPIKLLKEGCRVCKPGALLFLLLGPKNYQPCPPGLKRIGLFFITVVPNNEIRALNIYYKLNPSQIRTSKIKRSDKES